MGAPKSKASREDVLAVFQTEEPFKAAAVRLGMSPNTLRGIWKDAFGDAAFTSRGKRLQAEAAAPPTRRRANKAVRTARNPSGPSPHRSGDRSSPTSCGS